MIENKERILLTGASGSMGFEAFKLLWDKREKYHIVLLLRPSAKNKKKFREYEKKAAREDSLKIIWGDVLNREDVVRACQGIDWCLHPMALISPEADRNPEMAEKVNARGTRYLVEAIEAENPDHIKFIHIGTVAEYGDRLPPVHMGRTGDPVLPSLYDHYALSKIEGEQAVMQSKIRYRVSLRQTFIMIPGLFSLMDPIMFHQPVHSHMENITARDSGRLLVNCLDVEESSDFWGGYYNISGGPQCRITFLEFLDNIYSMLGIRYRNVMERKWFALKNFHMLFYEDSGKLNEYLHHWEGGQSQEDYFREVWKNLPWYLRATAYYAKHLPFYRLIVESATRAQLKKLAHKKDGTMGWVKQGDTGKINAFYGSMEAYGNIPAWDKLMPSLDHNKDFVRLQHGYDESKKELDLEDHQGAAEYRGGALTGKNWNGDMHSTLSWKCCEDHAFSMTPHAVLKGGHWCQKCISSPWDYATLAAKNPFASQVLTIKE